MDKRTKPPMPRAAAGAAPKLAPLASSATTGGGEVVVDEGVEVEPWRHRAEIKKTESNHHRKTR